MARVSAGSEANQISRKNARSVFTMAILLCILGSALTIAAYNLSIQVGSLSVEGYLSMEKLQEQVDTYFFSGIAMVLPGLLGILTGWSRSRVFSRLFLMVTMLCDVAALVCAVLGVGNVFFWQSLASAEDKGDCLDSEVGDCTCVLGYRQMVIHQSSCRTLPAIYSALTGVICTIAAFVVVASVAVLTSCCAHCGSDPRKPAARRRRHYHDMDNPNFVDEHSPPMSATAVRGGNQRSNRELTMVSDLGGVDPGDDTDTCWSAEPEPARQRGNATEDTDVERQSTSHQTTLSTSVPTASPTAAQEASTVVPDVRVRPQQPPERPPPPFQQQDQQIQHPEYNPDFNQDYYHQDTVHASAPIPVHQQPSTSPPSHNPFNTPGSVENALFGEAALPPYAPPSTEDPPSYQESVSTNKYGT